AAGRGERDRPGPAGEAAAGAPGALLRAGRIQPDAAGRRPGPRDDQPRSFRGGREGPFPPGPLLSAERTAAAPETAAGAARRDPAARGAFPEETEEAGLERGDEPALRLRLAGERPGTGQYPRAGGGPVAGGRNLRRDHRALAGRRRAGAPADAGRAA